MSRNRRKAQRDGRHESKTPHQQSSGIRRQNSIREQHANKRNSEASAQQAHFSEPMEKQLRNVPQPDFSRNDPSSRQLHREPSPLQQGSSQSPDSTAEGLILEQEQLHNGLQVLPIKSSPFVPYSDATIPILWSTQIDHSIDLSLPFDRQDSSAWRGYGEAVMLIKAGISRESFGLPAASKQAGSLLSIACVDLYYNIFNKNIYVASEVGLVTVPDYLKLCDIDPTRRLRFTGRNPTWAKTLLEKTEKRYVTEVFDEEPLCVRSEVQVFEKFHSFKEPAGLWGWMFSVAANRTVKFPLKYTANERPGPLSAVERKQVLGLPDKQPSPQELGEALFRQAQDYDRGDFDLSMTKSRDEYLMECGYLYGKFAPGNTQQKRGIFFDSPDPVDDLDFARGSSEIYPSSEQSKSISMSTRTTPSLSDADFLQPTHVSNDVQQRLEVADKQGSRSSSTSSRSPNVPTPISSTKSGSGSAYVTSDVEAGNDTAGSAPTDHDTAESNTIQAQQKRGTTPNSSDISNRREGNVQGAKDNFVETSPTRGPGVEEQSSHVSPVPPRKRKQSASPPPSSKKTKMDGTAESKDIRATISTKKDGHEEVLECDPPQYDDSDAKPSVEHDTPSDVSVKAVKVTDTLTDSRRNLASVPRSAPNESEELSDHVTAKEEALSADFRWSNAADTDHYDIEIPTYSMHQEEMNRRRKR